MAYANPTYDRFEKADNITVHAVSDVKGRTFVTFAADETDGIAGVKTCDPGKLPAGVAAYDAAATELTGLKRGNRVITVAVSADIPVGSVVEVGPNGTAVAHASGVIVGTVYGKGQVAGTNLIAINV